MTTLRRWLGSPRLRAAARHAIDRLPPRTRTRVLRAARAALARPAVATRVPRARTQDRWTPPPASFRVSPRPEPVPGEPPTPPHVDEPTKPVRQLYQSAPRIRYTAQLIEELNREYESKPVVPRPQQMDAGTKASRALSRMSTIHDQIGLAGLRVLEIGCGAGYEVWMLANHFGCDAHGLDVVERQAWPKLTDGRTHFTLADLTVDNPYPENSFDRILSFSVWEHIEHPYRALQETYKILKPGGLARILANLYRSPTGSHLYRDIFFPWPHLLFSDDVIAEWYEMNGRTPRRPSWVNKLTWHQYERSIEMAGFEIKMAKLHQRPFDEDFYRRFEDVLGRYPRFDLEKDGFTVVLQKPA